jgi:hypothetical protein
MPTPSQIAPVTGGAQAPGAPRAARFRLASPTTARFLAVLAVILVAAVVALSLPDHDADAELGAT